MSFFFSENMEKANFESGDQSDKVLIMTGDVKPEESENVPNLITKNANELQYFECILCGLREKYDYFGKLPPYQKHLLLQEDSYVIEDPFIPPKQEEILILGAHCIMCRRMVCKDANCSIFYNGTLCIDCTKSKRFDFPKVVQDKLNRIVK